MAHQLQYATQTVCDKGDERWERATRRKHKHTHRKCIICRAEESEVKAEVMASLYDCLHVCFAIWRKLCDDRLQCNACSPSSCSFLVLCHSLIHISSFSSFICSETCSECSVSASTGSNRKASRIPKEKLGSRSCSKQNLQNEACFKTNCLRMILTTLTYTNRCMTNQWRRLCRMQRIDKLTVIMRGYDS